MNAHLSHGLPVHASAPAGLVGRRTLQLAVAGALLLAVAEFGVLREYPEATEPADAIALASFGQAALEQLSPRTGSHAALTAFDVHPRAVFEEPSP